MSELKAYKGDIYIPVYGSVADAKVYLKSEADRYIGELVEGAISMFRDPAKCRGLDTQSPLGRIANIAFKYWRNIEERQAYYETVQNISDTKSLRIKELESKVFQLEDDVAYLKVKAKSNCHQKRKRCLAMAKLCNEKWLVHNFAEIPTKLRFYDKWEKRWLALADKFKEANNA